MHLVNHIAGLRADEEAKLLRVFDAVPELTHVILYGSRAKETHRPGSDVDLTLTGTLSSHALLSLSNTIDDLLLPYKVDLSLMRSIDNTDLVEHIKRVGKVVFSNG